MTHDYGEEYKISFRKVDVNDADLLKEFKCEYSAIREFIRSKSLSSQEDVSYLFVDEENNCIIGFCAICCTGISITTSNRKGERYRTYLPAAEIDYFAIDENYRSLPLDKESNRYETLSNALFAYILEHIKDVSKNIIGATYICLYSVPKAVSFYKRCGFEEFEPYMNSDEKPFVRGCTPMFRIIE